MFVTHIFLLWISSPEALRFPSVRPQDINCVSLSPWGGAGEKSAPGSVSDLLVLQNRSVWLRNSLVSPCVILLSELDEVLDKLNQGPSTSHPHKCWDNRYNWGRYGHKPASTKSTFKTYFQDEKNYATDELARFSVTGPTDTSVKLSEIHCRICRKDVLSVSHRSSQVLQFFQGIRHFARDQPLRLETPGWRVLGFDCKPLTEDGLERQCDRIPQAPYFFGTESTRSEKTWFRMLPVTLTLNFLCSLKFRLSSMCFNWVGAINWLNVCRRDLQKRPAE